MNDESLSGFDDALRSLVGRTCRHVSYGITTGTALHLHFTPLVKRDKPLRNASLSEEQKLYQGAASLYLTCAWRLESERRVLTGSGINEDEFCAMSQCLDELCGQLVIDAKRFADGGRDVILAFSNGKTLSVFRDRPAKDNFHLRSEGCEFSE